MTAYIISYMCNASQQAMCQVFYSYSAPFHTEHDADVMLASFSSLASFLCWTLTFYSVSPAFSGLQT